MTDEPANVERNSLEEVATLPASETSTNRNLPHTDEEEEESGHLREVDPMKYMHRIQLSEEDTRPNMSEEDFLEELEQYEMERNLERSTEEIGDNNRRRLAQNYDHVKWNDYQWLREVGTEYYFRYEGQQMVPPCYDKVHYRVMKDYIRVNPVQIEELQRLLAHRIAPKGSLKNQCQRDTAGKRVTEDRVDLARPLQSSTQKHAATFCECKDWKSKFSQDREWCELKQGQRLFERPYNFATGGEF